MLNEFTVLLCFGCHACSNVHKSGFALGQEKVRFFHEVPEMRRKRSGNSGI